MTADIGIKVTFGPLPAALIKGPDGYLVRQAAVEAINFAGPFVQRELAQATPVGATGKARQSVTYEPPQLGFGDIVGRVGYGAPASLYIAFANDGTRPHFPPTTPLVWWAARVLGDARIGYAIARSISLYGTRPQHFVEDTHDRIEGRTKEMMASAFHSFFDQFEATG